MRRVSFAVRRSSREGNRVAGPVVGVVGGAVEPASVARWRRQGRVRINDRAIAAAAITIAQSIPLLSVGFVCDVIPGRREAANPESRDSPM